MAFLSNDAINRVYLHWVIRALAEGAGGVFVLVFLLKGGLTIPVVLLAQAAIVMGRFVLRPTLLPLAKWLGLKTMLILGTVSLAAQYFVLPSVHGVGPELVILCLIKAGAEVLYWMMFNTTFSMLGDAELRGHQVSAREALGAVSSIIAPLIGAFALVTVGPRMAFAAVACIQLASAIPLLGLPNMPVRLRADGAFRAARIGILFSAIDGFFDTFFIVIWQIALFVTLGENFSTYGGAMALAGLVGAVCGLLLGRHIDRGHGRRVVLISYGVLAAVALARAGSLGSATLAMAGNAFGSLAMILISPALGVISNLAKASPCPLRFHMGTEAGWDAGCFAACMIAAMLLWSGASLAVVILLALPGAAASALVLWRLYPPHRAARTMIASE